MNNKTVRSKITKEENSKQQNNEQETIQQRSIKQWAVKQWRENKKSPKQQNNEQWTIKQWTVNNKTVDNKAMSNKTRKNEIISRKNYIAFKNKKHLLYYKNEAWNMSTASNKNGLLMRDFQGCFPEEGTTVLIDPSVRRQVAGSRERDRYKYSSALYTEPAVPHHSVVFVSCWTPDYSHPTKCMIMKTLESKRNKLYSCKNVLLAP